MRWFPGQVATLRNSFALPGSQQHAGALGQQRSPGAGRQHGAPLTLIEPVHSTKHLPFVSGWIWRRLGRNYIPRPIHIYIYVYVYVYVFVYMYSVLFYGILGILPLPYMICPSVFSFPGLICTHNWVLKDLGLYSKHET